MIAAAAIGGVGLQGAGMIMGSSSAKKAAKQAKKIGEFNAKVAEEEAEATRLSSRFIQQRAVKEGARTMGTLETRMAASGARLDVGAPLRALADLAQELDIEQLLIAYEGEKTVRRYKNQATVNRMGGSLEAKQLEAQSTANLISGAGKLLTGFSTIASQFGTAAPPKVDWGAS